VVYQTPTIPMISSNLPGHSPIASLFKWDISYSSVEVNKISTDMLRRAVPRRWLSFLFSTATVTGLLQSR